MDNLYANTQDMKYEMTHKIFKHSWSRSILRFRDDMKFFLLSTPWLSIKVSPKEKQSFKSLEEVSKISYINSSLHKLD